LPGTLLGLSKNTIPAARALDRMLIRQFVAGTRSKVLHPVAGVYGGTTGPVVAVVGGGECGTCAPKSAAATLRVVHQQFPDARLFSPGPNGGNLVCSPPLPGPNQPFRCWWFDDKTAGYVAYGGGSASGLADAAAKTRQVRAAAEH
jgi:hypothetical protein